MKKLIIKIKLVQIVLLPFYKSQIMKWSNKIIHCKGDKSQSKISSRSLSKFKRVNLEKSQEEISSHHQDQKSELKLISVEKIKPSHLNRSYISEYMNSSRLDANASMNVKKICVEKYNILLDNHQIQKNHLLHGSKSEELLASHMLSFGRQNQDQDVNGYSVFQNQMKKQTQPSIQSFNLLSKDPQNQSFQQKLKAFLQKFKNLFSQFKSITQNMKKQIDESTVNAFLKYQTDLSAYFKQFEQNLQSQFKMIVQLSQQKQILKYNYVALKKYPPTSPANDSFHKVRTFQQEQGSQQVNENNSGHSRVNAFKNRFKKMLNDVHESQGIRNQIPTHMNNDGWARTSPKKIIRKQTNPSIRVNSFQENDSSLYNEHNQSLHSMKYRRINDKSASKSVKKLHQKIVQIKKIFNSQLYKDPDSLNHYHVIQSSSKQ